MTRQRHSQRQKAYRRKHREMPATIRSKFDLKGNVGDGTGRLIRRATCTSYCKRHVDPHEGSKHPGLYVDRPSTFGTPGWVSRSRSDVASRRARRGNSNAIDHRHQRRNIVFFPNRSERGACRDKTLNVPFDLLQLYDLHAVRPNNPPLPVIPQQPAPTTPPRLPKKNSPSTSY